MSESLFSNTTTKAQVRPWERYWARVIDLELYALPILISGILLYDIIRNTWINPWLNLGYLITYCGAWVFIESLFLSTLGTTPGKCLLRIKVRDHNGKKLSFLQAFIRTLKVWTLGLGLGILFISFFTKMGSYYALTINGITSWDKKETGNHVISHGKIGIVRTIIATFLTLILCLIKLAIAFVLTYCVTIGVLIKLRYMNLL